MTNRVRNGGSGPILQQIAKRIRNIGGIAGVGAASAWIVRTLHRSTTPVQSLLSPPTTEPLETPVGDAQAQQILEGIHAALQIGDHYVAALMVLGSMTGLLLVAGVAAVVTLLELSLLIDVINDG